MFINVAAALLPAIIFLILSLFPESEVLKYRWVICYFIILIPWPTYLFFEVKHLILKDGIAEDGSLNSILVFGGQSLLGIILQVISIVFFLKLGILGAPNLGLTILLSFLAAFGACLGLTDLHLLYIFLPKKVFRHILKVVKSWRLVAVCISTTLLLSFLTSLFVQY